MAEVAQGTVVDGRYLIRDRIGSGGMADVYLADDEQLGREVALKVLHRRFSHDREFVERFRREASAAARLQHPNVVSVFDRGEHEDTYYIAMENLRGRTLKQLIQDEAPLDQLRVIDLGVQILQAAGFAHRRGVIHRDFKPHNVIVGDDDRLKVTDFGIARAGASEMTETGSIMGTAQYLSPEQAQGQRVGAASDLYSIGVILFEMLTGRVPFPGDSAVSIALKHVSEPPPAIRELRPDVHPLLEAAVQRALLKDPAERFQSADEFIAALEAARAAITSGNGQATAVFAPEPQRPRRRLGRRWPLIALALIALGLAGAAVALQLLHTKQVRVPSVVGTQLLPAEAIVRSHGLRPVPHGVNSLAPRGQVVAEHPSAGSKADKGSDLRLDYSTGPAKLLVPSVQNMRQAQAEATLKQTGFKVTAKQEPSQTVAQGVAIGTSPAGNTQALQGSTVTLFISSGPQLVTVPNVVGESGAAASAALQAVGLGASAQEVSDNQPAGQVISQNPTAGSSVPQGTTIALNVSKGPPNVSVPNVVGQDVGSAQSSLSGAGFNVKVVTQTSNKPANQVIRQSPGGGRQPKGSTVTLYVSTGSQNGGGGGGTGGGGGPGTAGGGGGNGQGNQGH